jgi:uncharacterized protein YdeI (YjbR/CyaY-like superfamily)
MIATDNFEQIEVTSEQAIRDWLAQNHAETQSFWLVTFKKHTGDTYVSTDQMLDALISFGWIDGIRRKLDDNRTMQLICQRKNQAWAKTYQDRAARLIADGLMQESGLAVIEASKAAGLWDATAGVDALEVPADLLDALDQLQGARDYFEAAAPSYRRNVLRWIFAAKTDATRQKRIVQTAQTSQQRERIPQL